MYPKINDLVRLLHDRGISTFLVTNAQFPDAIKYVHERFWLTGMPYCHCSDNKDIE